MNKTLTTLLLCMVATACFQPAAFSQNQAQVTKARLLGVTKPLRDLVPQTAFSNKLSNKAKGKLNKPSVPNFLGSQPMKENFKATAQPQGPDPVRQGSERSGQPIQVIPELVFDGLDETDSGIYPPDPNGYIGTNHYIQTTNANGGTVFEIFDKDGNSVYGPALTAPFWTEFGIQGFGDPIVVYDHEYDRWLITEFGPLSTSIFLIAVSATSDPLGSWYAYEFQAPGFPDYPKYSVWNNSYFITSNEGEDHIPVYALNRQQMLAGDDVVGVVRLPALPKFQTNDAFQVASPVTWDGPVPPAADEPGYVVRIYDDAWEGGVDGLELWQIDIDWADPNSSSAIGPIFIETEPFDSKICNSNIFDCIAQPNGSTLSVLEQIVMHRVQYRNFGTHESMVLNHVVDADGNNQSGIRWYELRRVSGGDWFIYQQGTWSPDGDHRFMGSIAMDLSGNILMGYSVTGPDQLLSLRYTGRLAGDPLGQMTVEEYEFGTALSINPTVRWGDYSCMTLDPQDNRTFWFTGEYMLDNGLWGTKIMRALIQRDSNDIGPQALIAPQNSGYLTAAEPVKVALRNYGHKPAADFTVSLVLNGNLLATEAIADTIQPDSVRLHTFTPTVDMSAIGPYPFTIYTTYSYDTTFINDTFRIVVKQLTRNDAAIIGFTGLDFPICDTTLQAGIILQNKGVDTLYSATINYQINGGTTFTINWTGALPPGQTEVVPFGSDEVVDGNNTVYAYAQLPNGVNDEDDTNDSSTRPFSIVGGGTGILLELLTDNYPNETTWDLFDENDNVLFSGGPYSQTQTVYTLPMCVAEGCYKFSIYDSFGDGMYWPSDGIMGNYVIYNAQGEQIANIANAGFGFQEDNDFCSDGTCSMLISFSVAHESALGAADGYAVIDASNGVSPFRYSIDDGVSFQSSPLFINLANGTYHYQVRDTSGCTMRDSFIIGTCTLQSSVTVTPAATSNSNDGAIEVTTVNGFPPFLYRILPGNFQSEPVFTNLDEGNYTVQITDSLGCLNSFEVTVSATTGTQNLTYGTSVKIFPNPTEESFRVEVKGLTGLDVLPVQLFDAQGKTVLHHRLVAYNGVLTAQLSLKAFPSGVYFLRLHDAASGFSQLMRVVKK
ncbi:MAG: T9SS type A sorting domain-containing protein [Bacteroidetes bacterium]|nr:T9SS type A sorting domain-containing protein [Bacteroidota bacterium]